VCDVFHNCAIAGPYHFTVDRKAPTGVSGTPDREPDRGTWYRDPVTVTFHGTDGGSGVAGCAERTYDGPDGANVNVDGTCTDRVGNESDPASFTLDHDAGRPGIDLRLSPDPAGTGWWNRDTGAPTAHFSCDDGISGVDACPDDQPLGEGADQSVEGTARDRAGNTRRADRQGIDVDLTDPTLDWSGGPTVGAGYPFGHVPDAPTCAALDTLSGPDGCSVDGYHRGVGTWELVATALDRAGNRTRERRTYLVLPYTIEGFGAPLASAGDALVVAKAGRTLPLRFRVLDPMGDAVTDLEVVSGLTATPIECATREPSGPPAPLAASGALRVEDGRFQVDWKLPHRAGCVRATITTIDDSARLLDVRLR
jgi:hypothetical protein